MLKENQTEAPYCLHVATAAEPAIDAHEIQVRRHLYVVMCCTVMLFNVGEALTVLSEQGQLLHVSLIGLPGRGLCSADGLVSHVSGDHPVRTRALVWHWTICDRKNW